MILFESFFPTFEVSVIFWDTLGSNNFIKFLLLRIKSTLIES